MTMSSPDQSPSKTYHPLHSNLEVLQQIPKNPMGGRAPPADISQRRLRRTRPDKTKRRIIATPSGSAPSETMGTQPALAASDAPDLLGTFFKICSSSKMQ